MTRNRSRSGFTLLELLAVISITSVVTVLAFIWLTETMKFSSRIRSRQRQHIQLTQLARNLRMNVQSSRSMSMDDQSLVLLQGNDRKMVYSLNGTTIEFEAFDGSQLRRERYPLARNSVIAWDTSDMPQTIGLIVTGSEHPVSRKPSGKDDAAESAVRSHAEIQTLPIDIHIFCRVNRWPVEYVSQVPQGGEQ